MFDKVKNRAAAYKDAKELERKAKQLSKDMNYLIAVVSQMIEINSDMRMKIREFEKGDDFVITDDMGTQCVLNFKSEEEQAEILKEELKQIIARYQT